MYQEHVFANVSVKNNEQNKLSPAVFSEDLKPTIAFRSFRYRPSSIMLNYAAVYLLFEALKCYDALLAVPSLGEKIFSELNLHWSTSQLRVRTLIILCVSIAAQTSSLPSVLGEDVRLCATAWENILMGGALVIVWLCFFVSSKCFVVFCTF